MKWMEDIMEEKRKKELFSWLKSIVIALVLALIIREFIFTPVLVSGQSMEPTFQNDNRVIITKIHTINHFDLIVFQAIHSETNFIKRVIGLPGDMVVMKDDHLYINGEEYEEAYVQSNKEKVFEGQKLTEDFEVEVPQGFLYVLGDNRENSTDSRVLGFIDEKTVVGEVKFRFYPLHKFGIPK